MLRDWELRATTKSIEYFMSGSTCADLPRKREGGFKLDVGQYPHNDRSETSKCGSPQRGAVAKSRRPSHIGSILCADGKLRTNSGLTLKRQFAHARSSAMQKQRPCWLHVLIERNPRETNVMLHTSSGEVRLHAIFVAQKTCPECERHTLMWELLNLSASGV